MLPQPSLGDIWYRYFDSLGHIGLEEFQIIRMTEKCVYVQPYFGGKVYEYEKPKRVLKDPEGRRFCYPTKALAANSFRIRKEWQERHLRKALENLQRVKLAMGKEGEIDLSAPGVSGDFIFNL